MTHDQAIYGSGWAFPVKPRIAARAPVPGRALLGGRSAYLSGDEKIRQSIFLILSTAPGERQMRPDFGCGIHDLLFQPNTDALRGVVRERVLTALLRWEPRIDVLDARVETSPEARNYLLIRIDYRIRANNAAFNLVYPFFLSEGNA